MTSIIPSRLLQHNQLTVLTTHQIAKAYGTTESHVITTFNRNKDRYTEEKHYFILEGKDLKAFATTLQSVMESEIGKRASKVYLWTEKGAWLLAKSLNTDEAWQACEMIVDAYYRQKEIILLQQERIKKLATLIGKNMTIPSLPPNVLGNVHADMIENAVSRLRGLIKPFKEYAEKAQKKRAIYLSTEEGQQLVSALQAMHENLNTIYVQSEHMQEVMDMGDMQFIKQESIIRQITQALELPIPAELLSLPEPN